MYIGYLIVLKYIFWGGVDVILVEMVDEGALKDSFFIEILIERVKVIRINFV